MRRSHHLKGHSRDARFVFFLSGSTRRTQDNALVYALYYQNRVILISLIGLVLLEFVVVLTAGPFILRDITFVGGSCATATAPYTVLANWRVSGSARNFDCG